MAIQTSAECKLYIGTTTAASTATEFEADTYKEVGEIEDPGEFGDQYNIVNFTALGDGRVRKRKGSKDAGDMSMTVAFDPDDEGQSALSDAADDAGNDAYNIKVTLNDAPTSGDPTTFYFWAFVTSRRITIGAADNVVRANITLAIDSAIIEVAAA